jgi:hypothetical protein
MKKAYDAEKAELQSKLDKANAEIDKAEVSSTSEDRFLFLNSLSKLFGIDKATMFTVVVLFIVALIDPLAITLILAGTFVLAQYQADRQKEKQNVPDHEGRPVVADGHADSGSTAGLLEAVPHAPEVGTVTPDVADSDVAQGQAEATSLWDAVFEPENLTPDTEPEEDAPQAKPLELELVPMEAQPDHTKIEPEADPSLDETVVEQVDPVVTEEPETPPDSETQAIIDELSAEEEEPAPVAPKRFIKVRHFNMGDAKPNDAE